MGQTSIQTTWFEHWIVKFLPSNPAPWTWSHSMVGPPTSGFEILTRPLQKYGELWTLESKFNDITITSEVEIYLWIQHKLNFAHLYVSQHETLHNHFSRKNDRLYFKRNINKKYTVIYYYQEKRKIIGNNVAAGFLYNSFRSRKNFEGCKAAWSMDDNLLPLLSCIWCRHLIFGPRRGLAYEKIKVSLKLTLWHPNDLSGMSRGGFLGAPLEYSPAQHRIHPRFRLKKINYRQIWLTERTAYVKRYFVNMTNTTPFW